MVARAGMHYACWGQARPRWGTRAAPGARMDCRGMARGTPGRVGPRRRAWGAAGEGAGRRGGRGRVGRGTAAGGASRRGGHDRGGRARLSGRANRRAGGATAREGTAAGEGEPPGGATPGEGMDAREGEPPGRGTPGHRPPGSACTGSRRGKRATQHIN
jgi:ATP-dependent RNA helicase DeaD